MNNKKESFITTLLHIGSGTIISMIISAIGVPIITRLVDPNEYGQLSIFNLYISIAMLVLCLGMDQTLVRYYYKENSIEYKRWILRRCFSVSLITTCVCSAVFILFIEFGLIDFEFSKILSVFILGILFELFNRFAVLVLRLEGSGKQYSLASIIHKASYVFLAIALIFITKRHSFTVVAIASVCGFLFSSLFAIYKQRTVWAFTKETKDIGIPLSEILKYGLPFIVATGLTTLFEAIDKLCLKNLCDYSVVGIYSSAIFLTGAFAIVQTAFNAAWAPKSVELYENNPEHTAVYSKYNKTITFFMFGLGFSFILVKDVFGLMLGEAYREAAQILPFLAFHPIMYTISETTVTGIVVKNKSHYHIIVAALVCIANLIGNLVLIPYFGAKGAAISTGCSYILFYAVRTFLADRLYHFDHSKCKFWIITLLTVGYATYNTFFDNILLSAVFYVVLIVVLCVLYKEVVYESMALVREFMRKHIKGKKA